MTESTLLGGRYELGEILGHGGMAEVRKAVDTRLGRTVAVKTLRSDLATDPTFQARFRREAQSAASLNHPAIVAVYDTGEEVMNGVGVPYIVMECVEGRTLRDVLREGRRILPERALEITGDVCDALEYSHRAGIVHRDIKPANVMLTPAGDVKVMDFGIARAVADASSTMTQTAAVIGTAQYLSPEQARGETVDSRSDIYSTGCLLYELLTSRPPFVGDSPVSVAYQHVREEPQIPSSLDSDITPEIDAIALKALAKRPEDRYQTAAEMRADIDRYLGGQPITAPFAAAAPMPMPVDDAPTQPVPPPMPMADEPVDEEEEKARKRRRLLWVLGIIAGIIIIAGLAFALSTFFNSGPDTKAVPDVVGEKQVDAASEVTAAGFKPEFKSEETDDAKPGIVFKTEPNAEEQAEEGSVVTVFVSKAPGTTNVPSVVGREKDAARAALEGEGLKVTEKADNGSDRPADEVTRTDPAGGTAVEPESEVVMYVSSGLDEVPSVVGQSESSARDTLSGAGFNVTTTYETTSEESPGNVLRQSPDGGKRAESGTTVTITIAQAPDDGNTPPPDDGTTPPPDDGDTPPPDDGDTPPDDGDTPPDDGDEPTSPDFPIPEGGPGDQGDGQEPGA